MNKHLYLVSFYLLFSSCAYYTLYQGTEQKKTITDIPLRSHNNNVDVFFNNELPAEAFYKVQIVDAVAPVNASYDELLLVLKQNAQAAGMDAVIIINKEQATQYDNVPDRLELSDTTIYRERQIATSYQRLSAIGLKYFKRINYMDSIVKSTIIDEYENGKARKLDIHFDYYGNFIYGNDKYSNEFYLNNILPFDIARHFSGNVAYWEYYRELDSRIMAFRLKENDVTYVSAAVDPFGTSRAITIHYKFLDPVSGKNSKYDLQCFFDNDGRLTGKQLLKKNYLVWKEKIEYMNSVVTGYSRFALVNGEERLLFKANNYFFSMDDLPKPFNVSNIGKK